MSTILEYTQGADLPNADLTWEDSNGNTIDFSSGYTFSLKVGTPGSTALLTKTTGITGAATAPNVTLEWATTGELNTLAVGTHSGQLKATRTSDSKHRFMPLVIRINPAIT